MLDTNIKTQLAAYLEKLQQPIELVATPDGSGASRRMRELLADIAALSPKVSVREDGQAERRPSFSVGRPGEAPRIHFAGLPMGHEFTSLILALLQSGGHPPKIDAALVEQLERAGVQPARAGAVQALVRSPFDDGDVDARDRQFSRQHQAGRPTSCNNHRMILRRRVVLIHQSLPCSTGRADCHRPAVLPAGEPGSGSRQG